jgi:hypothetical protein
MFADNVPLRITARICMGACAKRLSISLGACAKRPYNSSMLAEQFFALS